MSRSDRILIAAGGGAVVLALAAAWVLFAPTTAGSITGPESSGLAFASAAATFEPGASPSAGASARGTIVVDVEGAVAQPGIRELPAGSRVADAIAAAGGYAGDADLAATAASINLAQALDDGVQIRVPRIGEAAPEPSTGQAAAPGGAAAGSGGGAPSSGGLVDLNTATPEQLEALPGIGAVTVQKIVAARTERPFASLDDAVQRGVIHRGQLEDIQGLATAG